MTEGKMEMVRGLSTPPSPLNQQLAGLSSSIEGLSSGLEKLNGLFLWAEDEGRDLPKKTDEEVSRKLDVVELSKLLQRAREELPKAVGMEVERKLEPVSSLRAAANSLAEEGQRMSRTGKELCSIADSFRDQGPETRKLIRSIDEETRKLILSIDEERRKLIRSIDEERRKREEKMVTKGYLAAFTIVMTILELLGRLAFG